MRKKSDVKWFKEHASCTRFNILTSEQLFTLSQHSGASFPLAIIAPSSTLPARRVWRSTNNEEGGWCECSTWPIYMSTFFIFYCTDRSKIYSPLLMNVGEQQFFSPPIFYQRNLRSPIGTHNFKLSFFTGIHWHFWKWLIVTKQTNSS